MATRVMFAQPLVGAYFYRTVLDGRTFNIQILFNAREGIWYMDLNDAEGVPIKSGLKLVSQWPQTIRIADPRRPAGEILALDTTGQDLDAGPDELGDRVLLVYEEATA